MGRSDKVFQTMAGRTFVVVRVVRGTQRTPNSVHAPAGRGITPSKSSVGPTITNDRQRRFGCDCGVRANLLLQAPVRGARR